MGPGTRVKLPCPGMGSASGGAHGGQPPPPCVGGSGGPSPSSSEGERLGVACDAQRACDTRLSLAGAQPTVVTDGATFVALLAPRSGCPRPVRAIAPRPMRPGAIAGGLPGPRPQGPGDDGGPPRIIITGLLRHLTVRRYSDATSQKVKLDFLPSRIISTGQDTLFAITYYIGGACTTQESRRDKARSLVRPFRADVLRILPC